MDRTVMVDSYHTLGSLGIELGHSPSRRVFYSSSRGGSTIAVIVRIISKSRFRRAISLQSDAGQRSDVSQGFLRE
jgi:hypothetical protein